MIYLSCRYLLLVFAFLIATGCATRVGKSSKLTGYHNKIYNLSVVYNQPNHSDTVILTDKLVPTVNLLDEKLDQQNFNYMEEYLYRRVPSAFSEFGVTAHLDNKLPASLRKHYSRDLCVLLIIPARVASVKLKKVNVIPSSYPIEVDFKVFLFDYKIRKIVWRSDFKIIAGGMLYGSFSEELVASFLKDIIEKLQEDGLMNRKVLAFRNNGKGWFS